MQLLIQIGQLMLSLMLLVMLHEMGHFFTAKWFGVRVERFFVFFDPKFAIWKKKIGDTVYGIGWLPLGGYVKLSGMIDESMDLEQMKEPIKDYEFRAKPAWQRLIIMLGGIIVNILLAIIIFSVIYMSSGESYTDVNKMKFGLDVDSVQTKFGMQKGDVPIAVDGIKYNSLEKILTELSVGGETLTVKRNGQDVNLKFTPENRSDLMALKAEYVMPLIPAVVDTVTPHSAAANAGIVSGDLIGTVNGDTIRYNSDLIAAMQANKNKMVELTIYRKGKPFQATANIGKDGKLGIGAGIDYVKSLETNQKYGFIPAVEKGVNSTFGSITTQVRGIKSLFGVKDGRKQVSGPIGMVKQMPKHWDWGFFWRFTALISAWLAFINLLPIPGLDGGHAVFALYEIISGRKPSDKFFEKAQIAGVVIILGLMVFVFGNDIVNMIWK